MYIYISTRKSGWALISTKYELSNFTKYLTNIRENEISCYTWTVINTQQHHTQLKCISIDTVWMGWQICKWPNPGRVRGEKVRKNFVCWSCKLLIVGSSTNSNFTHQEHGWLWVLAGYIHFPIPSSFVISLVRLNWEVLCQGNKVRVTGSFLRRSCSRIIGVRCLVK